MLLRLLTLLRIAENAGKALAFITVLPGWMDCIGFRALLDAKQWLRVSLLIAAEDHGFVDGAAHRRPRKL